MNQILSQPLLIAVLVILAILVVIPLAFRILKGAGRAVVILLLLVLIAAAAFWLKGMS